MTFSGISMDKLKEYIDQRILASHPVGSYLVTNNPADPATYMGGGTWVKLGEGRTIISAGENYPAGSTGGEAQHMLTAEEMPVHKHNLGSSATISGSVETATPDPSVGLHTPTEVPGYWSTNANNFDNPNDRNHYVAAIDGVDYKGSQWCTESHSGYQLVKVNGMAHAHAVGENVSISGTTENAGSGEPLSLIQPYIAVYIWQRTA